MAHWKSFKNNTYLGEWDFEEEKIVTIDRVEQGFIEREDGEDEPQPFMYLAEYERPMILNSTNGKMISAMLGTTDTREWRGKRIILTRGLTTDKQGHPCYGIRVSPKRPPEVSIEPVETEAERLARLEREIEKARAAVRNAPRELPPVTSETITSADVAVIDAADKEIAHVAGR